MQTKGKNASITAEEYRPDMADLDNAVIGSWHSTLEFELGRVQQFATRAAASRTWCGRATGLLYAGDGTMARLRCILDRANVA